MTSERPTSRAHRRILAASAVSLLSLFAIPCNASGNTGLIVNSPAYWTGGTDGSWTGNNWASDSAGSIPATSPAFSHDVIFSSSGAAHQTTTLGANFTIHSLTINDPVPVTINSGTGGPFTLTLSGNAGTGVNVQTGAGLVTIGAHLMLSRFSDTITVNNTAGVVINGLIGGTNGINGLIKQGTGTLTLAGPNTYTGGTTVNAGTLAIDNDGVNTHGTLGGNTTVAATGNLKFFHLASAGNGAIGISGFSLFIASDGGGSRSTGPGKVSFYDHSTAGSANFFTDGGSGLGGTFGGIVNFYDSATAGDGKFFTTGVGGGSVNFNGNSTAGRASITATWGGSIGGVGSRTVFNDTSSAQDATIVAEGATNAGRSGGITQFNNFSHADNATIIANGGTASGAGGGVTAFNDGSNADNATLIANGGTNGGEGGAIIFKDGSRATTTTVKLSGNGRLDVSGLNGLIFMGSIEGSGNIFLGGTIIVLTGIYDNKTFSGVIQDGGLYGGTGARLDIFTPGTLTLTGANTYTGGTRVLSGTLAAGNAKAFGSGNLIVGGTLKTTGGPLAVDIGAGNIRIGGDGTFVATVGGTTPGVTHDQIKTTGSADITGGKLALVQVNSYRLKLGDKVVLISALGGVADGTPNGTKLQSISGSGGVANGTAQPFGEGGPEASVTGIEAFGSALLVPVVNVYPTSVILEVMQGTFGALAKTLAFTPNQTAIVGSLDQLIPKIGSNAEVTKAFDYFNLLPTSDIPALLEMLSPAAFTSAFNLSAALANVQSMNIQQRLADMRGSASAGGAAAGNPSGGGANGPTGARGRAVTPASEERWGMWMTGSGEFVHIGSTTNGAGFNLDSGGVTAGVDYRFTDHFAAGISIGYMNTNANLPSGGKMDVDGGRVGAYATYFDRGLHFDAAVSGGPNGYAMRRTTPGNTSATASPHGTEVNLLFAAGYDWKWKSFTLGPTASFQYTNVQLNGFTERGGFAPLSVASENAESLRSSLGFKASFDKRIGRAILRPEVRAAWQHEFGDVSHSLTASFATLGGTPFTVTGPVTGRDSMLLTAGFSVQWNARFATYAYYDAELFRTNYSSNNVSVGFRYQF